MFNLTTPRKTCTKCGEAKPATNEYFRKHKDGKDGLHPWCKDCLSEHAREYRAANKERIAQGAKERREREGEKFAERDRLYYQKNKDKVKPRVSAYAQANKEKVSRKNKEYRQANRDELLNRQREYYQANKGTIAQKNKRYNEANKDKVKARKKKYEDKNRDKINAQRREKTRSPDSRRVAKQRRRARKAGKPNTFTAKQWQHCLDYFGGCCAICGRPLYGILHTAHADHWIALSDPDSPGTVAKNMVCLCGGRDGCNESKASKRPDVWLKEKFGDRKAKQIAKRIQLYFDSIAE